MVEEETKRYRTTKNYLEYLAPVNLINFEVSELVNMTYWSLFIAVD